jgi:hypothetical protein
MVMGPVCTGKHGRAWEHGRAALCFAVVPPRSPGPTVSARALLPVTKLLELLEAAVGLTGDAQLGLHYIFTHSRDVRETLSRARRYLRLWNEGFALEKEESEGQALMRFEPRGFVADRRSEGLRQLFDLSTVTLVRNIRMSADPSFVPEEVHYFTEAHANTREHQRFFGGRSASASR